MEKVVLTPCDGGLGDSLILSTLPELFVREKGSKVYIRKTHFRNEGVRQLWEKNPFISGLDYDGPEYQNKQGEPTALYFKNNGNVIRATEEIYRFIPKNDYPKLYNMNYKYNYDLQDKTIVDLRSISVKYSEDSLKSFMHYLKECEIINDDKTFMITSGDVFTSESLRATTHPGITNKGLLSNELFSNIPKFHVNDIFEYANAIFSCKNFVCVASGSSFFASAIKNNNDYPKIFSLITCGQYNQNLWKLRNIYYFNVKDNYSDWARF